MICLWIKFLLFWAYLATFGCKQNSPAENNRNLPKAQWKCTGSNGYDGNCIGFNGNYKRYLLVGCWNNEQKAHTKWLQATGSLNLIDCHMMIVFGGRTSRMAWWWVNYGFLVTYFCDMWITTYMSWQSTTVNVIY